MWTRTATRPKAGPITDTGLTVGLPVGLAETALPFHHRGRWTEDRHLVAPGGRHVVVLYGIDEERMGLVTTRAVWSRRDAPGRFLGSVERLPLAVWAAWLDERRFVLKLNGHLRDWVRPMVVFDLAGGFAVLPESNGPAPDLTRLGERPGMRPYAEAALALEVGLEGLL